jgi:formamidase
MPEIIFKLDLPKKFEDQEKPGHNRWHPEIPPVATVKPGDSFRVDCRESFDGAIGNNDSAEDIRDAPLMTLHQLSGPIAVRGAKPGDLLIVDILDVGPIPQADSGPLAGQGWGYTGIFSRNNGGGFLTEQLPDAYKAIWDFKGQVATSRHVPEVRKEKSMSHDRVAIVAGAHTPFAKADTVCLDKPDVQWNPKRGLLHG